MLRKENGMNKYLSLMCAASLLVFSAENFANPVEYSGSSMYPNGLAMFSNDTSIRPSRWTESDLKDMNDTLKNVVSTQESSTRKIEEQGRKIDEQERKISQLESKNADLQRSLDQFKQDNSSLSRKIDELAQKIK